MKLVFLFGFSTALALLMLYPMFDAREGMPSADGVIMAWNRWHCAECVLACRNPLHTDLFLYPRGVSLAKHTLSPGFAPVDITVKWLSNNSPFWPFYALRVVVFGSFVTLFALTYILLRELSCGRVASGVVSACFTYADFFISHAQYPQFAAMWLYPLCTLLLLRLCRRPSFGWLLALAITVGASVYFTEMVALWCLGVTLVALLRFPQMLAVLRQTRPWWWLASGACSAIIAAPFLLAFAASDGATQADTARYLSADFTGFLIPADQLNPFAARLVQTILGVQYDTRVEIWLGWILPLGALLSLVMTQERRSSWPFLAVAGGVLLLSVGPDLRMGETVYQDVMPWVDFARVPPFCCCRAPYRLLPAALFALSIPAGLALSRIGSAKHGKWVLTACVALAAVEVYAPDNNVAASDRSGFALCNVFATPPPEFVEHITSEGVPGPWATFPPSFYDTAGVYAQMFHHQPICAGLWVSRWSTRQEMDYWEYHAVYAHAIREQNPEILTTWLRERGVCNLLVTRLDALDGSGLDCMAHTINVVDCRHVFTPENDPFAHAIRQVRRIEIPRTATATPGSAATRGL
ncbi:MAG: hypothetical protein IT365_13575 [Candidatus Hydrogenedentes bacterium]|nr:hypothetical protein [Candidatus Hydrogenedentota bacterium]